LFILIWFFLSNKIQEYIKIDNSLAILKNINITRSFIKPGILTISYGATSKGIADQLKLIILNNLI